MNSRSSSTLPSLSIAFRESGHPEVSPCTPDGSRTLDRPHRRFLTRTHESRGETADSNDPRYGKVFPQFSKFSLMICFPGGRRSLDSPLCFRLHRPRLCIRYPRRSDPQCKSNIKIPYVSFYRSYLCRNPATVFRGLISSSLTPSRRSSHRVCPMSRQRV